MSKKPRESMEEFEFKLHTYQQVDRGDMDRCTACGNPWWFEMEDAYSCITCGHIEKFEFPNREELQ